MANPTAFIVRPFGTKKEIDFERVHNELIVPALTKAGIEGDTTGNIVEAGNIRQDMFELLLTSDLVIADISIHNANVYYELGIRHALRDENTILIRCRKDEVPFDLKTDRYLAYDLEDLGPAIEMLSKAIEDTLESDKPDSPVYRMLPGLKKQDPERFMVIPNSFCEELELARNGEGGKLTLMAYEVERFNFSWALPALRLIAESQFKKGLHSQAASTWNAVLGLRRDDVQAHGRLSTIYQRMGELEMKRHEIISKEFYTKSDQAIDFLISQKSDLGTIDLAEAYSLKGRNEKGRWIALWMDEPENEVAKKAIASGLLIQAYESYLNGYEENLNQGYAGINALGLLKVILDLADREPSSWNNNFDDDEEASLALNSYKREFDRLCVVLRKTLDTSKSKLKGTEKKDLWLDLTFAEFALLTNTNPERVLKRYQDAIETARKENNEFNFYSALRQLRVYQKLDIMAENVKAVLDHYQENEFQPSDSANTHVILFSGHMIDEEGRKEARFPNELAGEVKEKIMKEVQAIVKTDEESDTSQDPKDIKFMGIAGGACGGDIIFHEVCKELEIPSELLLALPQEEFIAKSVRRGGNEWVDRFNALDNDPEISCQVLSESYDMPKWMRDEGKDYSFWQRNNLWTLYTAMAVGRRNITLLALWDGKEGDGPGGTKHMIGEIEKLGAKSVIISPQ